MRTTGNSKLWKSELAQEFGIGWENLGRIQIVYKKFVSGTKTFIALEILYICYSLNKPFPSFGFMFILVSSVLGSSRIM